ncbi:MAG: sulfate adenylyltransferase subunit CysN [Actinobacteria bacterium]|nr:MAG: sulfate adenylyltransferase subunit CysN [Actinomycetota bacterium]
MTAELVRLATTGSVDDGKSTLIGRLLYDSKQIFQDQLDSVEDASRRRGTDYVDLALLTDGLRAEREQGITIDVAYRYFSTPKRKFILADTPGHIQYTRNMVTGSSTANIALILVDARNGVVEQTKRHAFLASLLGVPHLVLCVNKMDLVDWSQDRFDEVVDEFREFATKLAIHDLRFVPVSALLGDNIVNYSENMSWYRGPTVIELLEEIHVASDFNMIDVRFPVQYVVRPHRNGFHDYRGYAGTVAGGLMKPGDEVMVLPSGFTTRIARIDTFDGPVEQATPPMSVVLKLEDDLDISRGDMICRPHNQPDSTQDLDAMICWMSESSGMEVGSKYAIKHTTKWGRVMVKDLQYRLDVNTLHRDESSTRLDLNEIGRVRMRATTPFFVDEYRRNRQTGSFILVDEATNSTVAAGMVTGKAT